MSQCGHFADKGVNFSQFCADVLNERPLTVNSNQENQIAFVQNPPLEATV